MSKWANQRSDSIAPSPTQVPTGDIGWPYGNWDLNKILGQRRLWRSISSKHLMECCMPPDPPITAGGDFFWKLGCQSTSYNIEVDYQTHFWNIKIKCHHLIPPKANFLKTRHSKHLRLILRNTFGMVNVCIWYRRRRIFLKIKLLMYLGLTLRNT